MNLCHKLEASLVRAERSRKNDETPPFYYLLFLQGVVNALQKPS